jgi:hypothetical protein
VATEYNNSALLVNQQLITHLGKATHQEATTFDSIFEMLSNNSSSKEPQVTIQQRLRHHKHFLKKNFLVYGRTSCFTKERPGQVRSCWLLRDFKQQLRVREWPNITAREGDDDSFLRRVFGRKAFLVKTLSKCVYLMLLTGDETAARSHLKNLALPHRLRPLAAAFM